LRLVSWMENICFARLRWQVYEEEFIETALRISSGGRTVTLLQVAATKTAGLRSCIQERNDASRRDETPASALAESGPLPAKTFSSSSIHNTQGASLGHFEHFLNALFRFADELVIDGGGVEFYQGQLPFSGYGSGAETLAAALDA